MQLKIRGLLKQSPYCVICSKQISNKTYCFTYDILTGSETTCQLFDGFCNLKIFRVLEGNQINANRIIF